MNVQCREPAPTVDYSRLQQTNLTEQVTTADTKRKCDNYIQWQQPVFIYSSKTRIAVVFFSWLN